MYLSQPAHPRDISFPGWTAGTVRNSCELIRGNRWLRILLVNGPGTNAGPFLGFGVGFRAWAPNLSEQRLAWGHLVKDFASSLNRGRNLDAPSASSNWRSRAHVQ